MSLKINKRAITNIFIPIPEGLKLCTWYGNIFGKFTIFCCKSVSTPIASYICSPADTIKTVSKILAVPNTKQYFTQNWKELFWPYVLAFSGRKILILIRKPFFNK
jgi:hypothetical protein